VAAAYRTGLRIAEVANLKVADVEWRMSTERP
jgi:site-specific recombinase XerD